MPAQAPRVETPENVLSQREVKVEEIAQQKRAKLRTLIRLLELGYDI